MKVNIINTTCFKITITHIYFNSCTCITETIAEGEKAETTKNIPPAKKIESDNDGTSSDELGRQHDKLPNKTIEMDPDSDRKHPPDTIVVKKVNSMLDREEEENLMRSPDSTALSHNSDQSNFLSNASKHFHKKQRKGSYPNVKSGYAWGVAEYVRNSLFPRAKFLNTTDCFTIESEIFIRLNIQNDKEEQDRVRQGIFSYVKDTLGYRRNHSIRKVKTVLRSKYHGHALIDKIINLMRTLTNPILALLLEKTMFDVDLMDQFYDHEPENKDFDVDESVKRAYYVFIKRIATAISPKF